jgi:hypothetical protein
LRIEAAERSTLEDCSELARRMATIESLPRLRK